MVDIRLEDFTFNDLNFKINPNDISFHERKTVESYTGARDDAGVTASEPFFTESYFNVLMTFDITDSTDLNHIVRIRLLSICIY
jgi:hypothetical protein